MRQLLIIALAFVLTGCAALSPTTVPTAAPTNTPQIVVQTVVVTVLVTVPPTNTLIPTATLTPIPTFTPQPSDLTASAAATGTVATGTASTPTVLTPALGTSPTATLPDNAGGGIFTNLSRSSDRFAVNCPQQPDAITFGLSTTNTDVTEVDLFYRMENQAGTVVSGWVDIGKMVPDGSGNFSMDFKASMVDPAVRSRNGWLDYQFVGLGRGAAIIGRSAKIVKQITYMLDCSG
jgi:hypothetical protein